MNALDIIVLILFARAIYVGATRGLLRVLLSFLAAFLSAVLVYLFAAQIVAFGTTFEITSAQVCLSLAFLVLLCAIYVIGWLGTKVLGAAGLGVPNKILGMIFSVLKTGIITGGLLFFIQSLFAYFEKPLPELVAASFSLRALNVLLDLI